MKKAGAGGAAAGNSRDVQWLRDTGVAERVEAALASAVAARPEVPLRFIAECIGGSAPAPAPSRNRGGGSGEYLRKHRVPEALAAAVDRVVAQRPPSPLRALAAALRGAAPPEAGPAARPAAAEPPGSIGWAGAERARALSACRALQERVEQVHRDLDSLVHQMPEELRGDLREGVEGIKRSASGLGLFADSIVPVSAAAAGDTSRFGDGMDKEPQQAGEEHPPCRYHEDCAGSGEVVPDPPGLAEGPKWPRDWSPPRRWAMSTLTIPDGGVALRDQKDSEPGDRAQAGEELAVLAEDGDWLRVARGEREWWVRRGEAAHAGLTAAWLRAAQEGLEALSQSPRAPLAAAAVAPPHMQPRQEADEGGDPAAAYAARAPSMLEWLFTLPAQWAAADLGDTFGNFQTWKYCTRTFIELGGSQFHPGDIVCAGGRHLPRTGGRHRTCCATMNALDVLNRMRAAVEPGVEPHGWPAYDNWLAGTKSGPPPVPRAVPAEALARLTTHDALDGILTCFLYTYNLQCPNDFNDLRMLKLPSEGPAGWTLNGLCVTSVTDKSRAAQAGVRAKDVVVFIDSDPVANAAEVQELSESARTVGVVRARCQPRPLQLYGCVNWAMREAAGAAGVHAKLLRRALSVLKAFIWRLDHFISRMEKRSAILFRGLAKVRTARYYRIGAQIVFPAFTSLSENAEVAWGFAGEDGGTWLSVQVLEALEVAWVSMYPGEEELLLGSNTQLGICDKPADDVRSVLSTTNDAVSLVQRLCGGHCSPASPGKSAAAVLKQRLDGLKAQQVIFSTFKASYVEPRVRRHSDGKELLLTEAYVAFAASDAQWCVIIGALGQGKKSALLYLYSQELGKDQRVPLFVSVPLVAKVTEEDGWLRRQVYEQLSLGSADGGWAELERRQMVVFADSADESSARPDDLRERCLASRSGLPPSSKGILSVRKENLRRMGIRTAHLGGEGCTVLHLMPFGDQEQLRFCDRLAQRAAAQAAEQLKQVKDTRGEARAAALRELPGCPPPEDLVAELHDAVLRGDDKAVAQLRSDYALQAAKRTHARVAALPPRTTNRTTLYSMAAEVAGELGEGVNDAGAVIEAALRRRMRRGAALVDPSAWKAARATREVDKVDALMRVAEAVAASLMLNKTWKGRIGSAAEDAAPLCEVGGGPALLLALFPGLPLRTPSAEDPDSPFALPHRQVHEWLATRWAVRACGRDYEASKKAKEMIENLKRWGGAFGTAADAAAQMAEAGRQLADRADGAHLPEALRRAKQARIDALAQQGDKDQAVQQLKELVAECTEAYGEEDELAVNALYRQGKCLCEAGRCAEAVGALRRARELRERQHGPAHSDTLAAVRWLGYALVRVGEWEEGEKLLRGARSVYEQRADPGDRYGALKCDGSLATLYGLSGRLRESEELRRAQIKGLEGEIGRSHPDTLSAVCKLGDLMLARGPPALQEGLRRIPRRPAAGPPPH